MKKGLIFLMAVSMPFITQGKPLEMNGKATRTVYGVKVYDVSLWLTSKTSDADYIMNTCRNKKSIRIAMLRKVSAEKFNSTIEKNITTNLTKREQQQYSVELEEFLDCFGDGSSLVRGDSIVIDYIPGEGTQVKINEREISKIQGDEFYHILLRLWIGNPLQESIKQGLLG